ncbi:hypothetical protein JCM6882_006604 [Rhodosporidiobolus microsporus]
MSSPPPDADAPPPLTPEQKHRILHSPAHRRIKAYAYTILFLGLIGGLANVTGLIVGAALAKAVVDADKWFIFHYVVAATLSLLWAVYTFIFERDVKMLGWPDQLQIDIGWMMFADGFSICFMLYIFRKMRTYGILDVFVTACSTGCLSKLSYVKISPLILSVFSLIFGAIQLILAIFLYKNPIINPPMDAHGMPVAQNPETGEPLPLDADGKPILPDWLKPPGSARQAKMAPDWQAGGGRGVAPPPQAPESSEESGSEDEKRPLRATKGDEGLPGGLMEMGKKGGRREKSRREGRR